MSSPDLLVVVAVAGLVAQVADDKLFEIGAFLAFSDRSGAIGVQQVIQGSQRGFLMHVGRRIRVYRRPVLVAAPTTPVVGAKSRRVSVARIWRNKKTDVSPWGGSSRSLAMYAVASSNRRAVPFCPAKI
jgi:hypothetical protein